MPDWSILAEKGPFFTLVLFRITGIMILAPVFGSRNIPVRVRALLSIVIAAAILPVVPTQGLSMPATPLGYVSAVIGELSIGFILGFITSMVFIGVQLAGHIVGQQMGLTLANVLDPQSNQQVSLVGQLQFFFAVTLFILVKGHHLLIATIVGTFSAIPLMGLIYRPAALRGVADEMMGQTFVIAVRLSAPAVAALMLTSVAMAFIARTVPEMNIFNIGFAIRLALGLVVAALTVPAMAQVLLILFDQAANQMDTFLELMEQAASHGG